MAAIDYGVALASLDVAIATATGADLALGTDIRARLAAKGADLTERFTGDVDTAKTAWAAAASAAFDEAEEAAGYVYSVVGAPAPPNITFNLYDDSEMRARLSAAEGLTTDAFLQRVIVQHRATWNAAFATRPAAATKYTSPSRTASDPHEAPMAPSSLEREIYALLAEAASWLALAAL